MYETILFEKAGGVANVALNRPKKLNAFDGTMHEELYAALDEAANDDEIRCVVLRGEGRGFSAGADLAQIIEGADGDPDLGEYLRGTYSRLVKRMVSMEKPIVASLHGPVYGAGVGISLACDLRVAAESAKFSVAFIKIGLMPDAGVSFFLPRVVGLGRAVEMSMLGDPVEAEEALRTGLVNKVVPDDALAEETAALASRLASMPTAALGKTKLALYASFEGDLDTVLEREAEGQTFCGYTADHKEGVKAFFEKREARFTGR
ncbi:2-(1,2-epoxy-1,2-dihydrophenyl)acetyl-CoA isomerase [Rubrobacter tropicus]|uniref:2-(1,2-epoxy-1,2-dihydrophenyl)acetyl-CoA isomerase n=1 Tax=Rubrobacter tropicus TaxID=2653851 RepID=A0A6G8Q6L5_9ACTN|nr:enoyl-CoA hydratase-related protein [Rubrobacter tropicus]QIN82068.1 2-(1,2-epoxy-1,2-dihydrophenyl)acetyl-CoA isomerase [Rubrobacter tropicus]